MENRIRELREKKRMSQRELAKLANTSKQTISRLERGEQGLTLEWMQRLAPHLDVSPKELFEDAIPMASASTSPKGEGAPKESLGFGDDPMPKMERSLPILGRDRTTREGVFYMPKEQIAIDWTARPPQLDGVKEAYGVFVYDDCMSPKYEEGQTLCVHPGAPCKPGVGIVLIKHNDEAMVKVLVRRTLQSVRVRQFNPPGQFDVPQTDIRAIHRVVATLDPI